MAQNSPNLIKMQNDYNKGIMEAVQSFLKKSHHITFLGSQLDFKKPKFG